LQNWFFDAREFRISKALNGRPLPSGVLQFWTTATAKRDTDAMCKLAEPSVCESAAMANAA
jgi:hypothetical protein